MSRIKGADEMIKALSSLADNEKKIERAMLTAGGEVMEDAWRTAIQAAGHVRSESMLKNVTSRIKIYSSSGMAAIVTSDGEDDRGVRNGYKAYVTHYGNSRQPGSHWIDYAEQIGMPPARAAMESVLSAAIEGTISTENLPSGLTYAPFDYSGDRNGSKLKATTKNYFINPNSYWYQASKRAQNKSRY